MRTSPRAMGQLRVRARSSKRPAGRQVRRGSVALLTARTLAERRPHLVAFAHVFLATLFCFVAVGAVLPILPRYVVGPLAGGDVEVGLVAGVFAFTSIIGRPIGGRLADERGRRIVVLA